MPTMLTTDRADQCIACTPADLVSLERTRFFPRQLVGPDDLTQDQVYFREKARRHNRLLHGWGIVCGAGVKKSEGCEVEISSGYILGPFGDEILIPEAVRFDVCKEESTMPLDCGDVDPWCADRPRLREDQVGYLAVRYVERATRPVTVTACGCGCNDGACEYSRTRDGFEFAVLDDLPSTYRGMEKERPVLERAYSCVGEWRGPCPPCPPDPWVILADVTVSGGEVSVDCNPHRRYVVSFADYWFPCGASTPAPPATICHRVYGYEWEGISAMPPNLAQALQAGNITSAIRLGLIDIGTVEFTSGESANPTSNLRSSLPFTTDSLWRIYVYPVDPSANEPATAQAGELADLVVSSRFGISPIEVTPASVPSGVDCPYITVVVLGIYEIG